MARLLGEHRHSTSALRFGGATLAIAAFGAAGYWLISHLEHLLR